jgi:S-adenosylmethionine:tRNA ribosyltransferase-isomerase
MTTTLLPTPIRFELPPALEAHEPPEARGLARDEVRLLVSERSGAVTIGATFRELPLFVQPGDLIVVNDSATLAAALPATRADGVPFALHLSTRLDDGAWVVEPRKTEVVRGETATLPDGGSVRFIDPHHESRRLWRARLVLPTTLLRYLREHGKPIAYPYVTREWPIEMYQTVYARHPGSAEMPSAGRAFSGRVIDALRTRGIRIAAITLHTGVASLEHDEPPYEEWYRVPASTARAANAARARGSRVIAVGTTVIRALESAADDCGVVQATSGWTDIVVTPERGIITVDGLITGFHEPRASHLLMLEALAGAEHLQRAYDAAVRNRYLWHEFGDLHLILR